MPKHIDITGQKFNKLTAISFDHTKREPNGKPTQYWLFKCDCGKEKVIKKASVLSGRVKTCGCLLKKNGYQGRDGFRYIGTQGISNTPVAFTFNGMLQRCYNVNNPKYKNYGARGIKVCDLWLNDPKEFYTWAMENGYEKGLSIDRIDVNGDYCPSNCRWTTMKVQQRNRTNNRRITFNGLTKCTTEWDDYLGFPNGTVRDRLQRGYSEKDAILTPFGTHRKSYL